MAIRIYRRIPTSLPIGGAILNESSARGLVAAFAPGIADCGLRDLVSVSGLALGLEGAAHLGVAGGTSGLVLTSSGRASVVCPSHLKLTGAATIVMRVSFYATAAINTLLFGVTANNTGTSPWAGYGIETSGGGYFRLGFSNGASYQEYLGGASYQRLPVVGAPLTIIGLFQSTGQGIYFGPNEGAFQAATWNPSYSATSLLAMGGGATNACIEYGLIYNRRLAPIEMQMFRNNPYHWLRVPQTSQFAFNKVAGEVSTPNVVGLTEAAAETALVSAGLIKGTVTTLTSLTVPAGTVISQSPVAGFSLAAGADVDLVVSSGGAVVIVIRAGTVASDLSNFPVHVKLADLPTGFWSGTVKPDGADLRVRLWSTNALVPMDLVAYDPAAKTGSLFFKAALLSATAHNAFVITWNGTDTALPVTDSNGRNAVWADYHRVFFLTAFDGFADHTGAGTAPAPVGNVSAFVGAVVSPELNSQSGVAFDGTYFYTTDVNAIYKWTTAPSAATVYANPGGTGNRTSLITVTGGPLGQGAHTALVDGSQGDTVWFSNATSLTFQFGTPRLIDEVKFYQSNASAHGTWQWQGSNNGTTWTDIGGTFTFGGVATQTMTTLSGNVTGYVYYRMVLVGGATSTSPWIREFEFKIDSGSWSVVATNANPCGAVGFGTNRCGDPEVVGAILYVPVENYVNTTTWSAMRIARFNASDLSFVDSVDISAQAHEAAALAYADDGYLYLASSVDPSKLLRFNLTTLAYVSTLTLSGGTPTNINGLTYWRGKFWLAAYTGPTALSFAAPVAHWPLDEGTGTTAADASGNGHTATLSHGTWDTTSLKKFGPAALKKTEAALPGATFTPFSLGTVHTVAFWINDWNGVTNGIVVGTGTSAGSQYAFYIHQTVLNYAVSGTNYVQFAHGGNSAFLGAHHLAVVRNGTSITFYRDGIALGGGTLNANTAIQASTLCGMTDGDPFVGTVDDVRIYGVALNATQVAELAAYNPDGRKKIYGASPTGVVDEQPVLTYSTYGFQRGLSHTPAALLHLYSTAASQGKISTLTPRTFETGGGIENRNPAVGTINDEVSYARASGVTRYTQWTIGLSGLMTDKAGVSENFIGYSDPTGVDRTVMGWRQSTDRFGLWNAADSWVNDTGVPSVATKYRLHDVHDGTASRKLYKNGVVVATDLVITVMPPATANALYLGISGGDLLQPLHGSLGFVYLRPGVLSDAWIAAEYANLNTAGWYLVGLSPARITQAVLEALSVATPPSRVSQLALEVLSSQVVGGRVSQLVVETLTFKVPGQGETALIFFLS